MSIENQIKVSNLQYIRFYYLFIAEKNEAKFISVTFALLVVCVIHLGATVLSIQFATTKFFFLSPFTKFFLREKNNKNVFKSNSFDVNISMNIYQARQYTLLLIFNIVYPLLEYMSLYETIPHIYNEIDL